MELTKYIACICEGAAEQAVIEILLDNNRVIFGYDDLLDGEVIRSRSAKSFEQQYLRKGFTDKITVLRILDSRREKFSLSKAYVHKIEVVNIITAPEIEMLVIFAEGKYNDYKKSGEKPSEYCKSTLGYNEVKTSKFIKEYFCDVKHLIDAINEYRRVSKIPKGEYTLADLIK